MLLIKSRRSHPGPSTVVSGVQALTGVSPAWLPEVLRGDSCPWPRAEGERSGRGNEGGGERWDIVEDWGRGSFPASDPPANW